MPMMIGDSDVKVLSSRREIVGCQMQARDSLQSDFSKRFFTPGLTFPILAHHLWGNFGIAHHLKTPLDWSFNRWCIQYTSGAKFVFKPKFWRSFSDLIFYNLKAWIFKSDFEQSWMYIFSCLGHTCRSLQRSEGEILLIAIFERDGHNDHIFHTYTHCDMKKIGSTKPQPRMERLQSESEWRLWHRHSWGGIIVTHNPNWIITWQSLYFYGAMIWKSDTDLHSDNQLS